MKYIQIQKYIDYEYQNNIRILPLIKSEKTEKLF